MNDLSYLKIYINNQFICKALEREDHSPILDSAGFSKHREHAPPVRSSPPGRVPDRFGPVAPADPGRKRLSLFSSRQVLGGSLPNGRLHARHDARQSVRRAGLRKQEVARRFTRGPAVHGELVGIAREPRSELSRYVFGACITDRESSGSDKVDVHRVTLGLSSRCVMEG